MTEEGNLDNQNLDLVHPKKSELVAYRNYTEIVDGLDALRVPESPFFLMCGEKDPDGSFDERFILFIAPSKRGRFIGLTPERGPLIIGQEGVNVTSNNPNKIKLQDATEKIILDSELQDKDKMFSRRTEDFQPRVSLQIDELGREQGGLRVVFEFPVQGIGTSEDVETAIENSRKRAKRLHDKKYKTPREKLSTSEQILDFVNRIRERS